MSAPTRKITVSIPGDLVQFADRWAARTQSNRSQVISQALAEARSRELEDVAAQGYRFYSQESEAFAESSAGAVAEAIIEADRGDADHDGETW